MCLSLCYNGPGPICVCAHGASINVQKISREIITFFVEIMSHLKKLAVRGIRSFGPDDEETIEFMTPLTLILGQNGCGKTVPRMPINVDNN